jgi:hypothetical protein
MLFKKVMIMWVVKNKHQNTKTIEKQRDVNQEYHNDKSFKNIKTTKVLFEKALK